MAHIVKRNLQLLIKEVASILYELSPSCSLNVELMLRAARKVIMVFFKQYLRRDPFSALKQVTLFTPEREGRLFCGLLHWF